MAVTVSSRGAVAKAVTYLFVDAGHLKPNFASVMTPWFGRAIDLEVPNLRLLFSATKVFYYDSIDDVQGKNESAEQLQQRVRRQEAELREINSSYNTHVRFGSITGQDRKRRRQKEVDILIAVDMMNHAVRGNMDRAVLLSGDRDFTPLVETLVQFGLAVEVAGDFRFTSDVLRAAADYYRPLGVSEYSQLVHQKDAQQMPKLPSFGGGPLPEPNAHVEASGNVGSFSGKVIARREKGFFIELTDGHGSRFTTVDGLPDLRRVALFLESQYAEVPWLNSFVDYLAR